MRLNVHRIEMSTNPCVGDACQHPVCLRRANLHRAGDRHTLNTLYQLLAKTIPQDLQRSALL